MAVGGYWQCVFSACVFYAERFYGVLLAVWQLQLQLGRGQIFGNTNDTYCFWRVPLYVCAKYAKVKTVAKYFNSRGGYDCYYFLCIHLCGDDEL